MPTPKGELLVEWNIEKDGKDKALTVAIPKGMQVNLDLNSLKNKSDNLIRINGEQLKEELRKQDYLSLNEGDYLIHF